MLKDYYRLTKPGIIRGNLITATAGFLLASTSHVELGKLLAALGGTSLVIASACVFNNYIDRNIDKMMTRTSKRALATGLVSGRSAFIYATSLGLLGVLLLAIFTNILTAGVVLVGFFFYVVMYSIWKRRSVYGTIVGSISGAIPPVVGYTAAGGHLDKGALILFLILVFWQMPHFYAIAIYRLRDYRAANIPVLPLKQGIKSAKLHILIYIVGFTIAAAMLTIFDYTSYVYLLISLLLGLAWLGLGLKGFNAGDSKKWARMMFHFSLVVITVLCITISADALLL